MNYYPQDGEEGPYVCEECNGTGIYDDGCTCPYCDGEGVVDD